MKRATAILRLMNAEGKKDTKTTKVLKHLINNKEGITSMTAIREYKATRLAVIISELRHHYGIPIETIRETTDDGTSFGRYVLAEEEESA